MKLEKRIKTLCAATAMMMLFTSCGNAVATQDTEKVEPTENIEVTVEKEETHVVTTPSEEIEETVETKEEVVVEEPAPTPEELEQQEWQNYLMPNVEEYLNVRVEANADADLAGKLEKGDRATVLEKGAEWTKIESGSLTGYVNNQYCFFGSDALAYAKENCRTIAKTTTDGLRIRKEMNVESDIIDCLDLGSKVVVDTNATTEEGWVAVKRNDATYYVSAEYVEVSMEVGTGMTVAEMEEIARREAEEARKAAEKKAKEEQAKKEAAQKVSNDNSSMSKVDDLTLMAAIIYCEAGGEPYETQVAVGSVIMNRIQSGRFPNTLYGVISQKGQFTPYRTGKLARVLAQGKASSSCYEAARATLGGQDNTDGCLFFNDYYGTREGIRYGGMVFWW